MSPAAQRSNFPQTGELTLTPVEEIDVAGASGGRTVLAILLPSRELITLDLPMLLRPRNAISGRSGAGKCATPLADNMNRDKTRIN